MIKKIAMSLLCVAALGTTAQAENETFIGFELGYQNSGLTVLSLDGVSIGTDDTSIAGAFRVGSMNDEWRSTFTVGSEFSSDTDVGVIAAHILD